MRQTVGLRHQKQSLNPGLEPWAGMNHALRPDTVSQTCGRYRRRAGARVYTKEKKDLCGTIGGVAAFGTMPSIRSNNRLALTGPTSRGVCRIESSYFAG